MYLLADHHVMEVAYWEMEYYLGSLPPYIHATNDAIYVATATKQIRGC